MHPPCQAEAQQKGAAKGKGKAKAKHGHTSEPANHAPAAARAAAAAAAMAKDITMTAEQREAAAAEAEGALPAAGGAVPPEEAGLEEVAEVAEAPAGANKAEDACSKGPEGGWPAGGDQIAMAVPVACMPLACQPCLRTTVVSMSAARNHLRVPL
jgi:hypothetical protein